VAHVRVNLPKVHRYGFKKINPKTSKRKLEDPIGVKP
jgi:hypothetical protein